MAPPPSRAADPSRSVPASRSASPTAPADPRPGRGARPQSIPAAVDGPRRPSLWDVVLAAGVLLAGTCWMVLEVRAERYDGPLWVLAVVLLVCTVPLVWRRSHPAQAASVVVLGLVLHLFALAGVTLVVVTAPLMVYAVARYEPRRRWAPAFLVAAVLGAYLAFLYSGYGWNPLPWRPLLVLGTLTASFPVAAWAFGLLARQRSLTLAHWRARAEASERERDHRVRLAAQEERTRIARDMHDVVAHSLSVIVVQSDGVEYGLEHTPDDAEARHLAGTAIRDIGRTARGALHDTRRLVSVLRDGEEPVEFGVGGGIAEIDELVAPLRAAGREVDVQRSGPLDRVPRDIGVAAYRIIQESLTNIVKHAGPRARADVRIDYDLRTLRIRVADDGSASDPTGVGAMSDGDGRGHGLIGMRERVAAYGGELVCGPLPAGGFEVGATIPCPADDAHAPERGEETR